MDLRREDEHMAPEKKLLAAHSATEQFFEYPLSHPQTHCSYVEGLII